MFIIRYIGYDWVRLTSQSCGLYGPIFPRAIFGVDQGMMILTDANSQLAYQSPLAAPSTGWRSCHPRYLWSEWDSER
jgi:hypothetical protein